MCISITLLAVEPVAWPSFIKQPVTCIKNLKLLLSEKYCKIVY